MQHIRLNVKWVFVALLSGLVVPAAHSQKWLEEPKIRVCEKVVTCDDEKHIDLSGSEIAFVESLMRGIPRKSSAALVSRYFGHPPSSTTEPFQLEMGKWKGRGHRATWHTKPKQSEAIPSHVDVYFIDGEAFLLKWWFNGMMKMVQLTYIGDDR
jgi:hypothetical protein